MGVKDLWPILEPVKTQESLSKLSGQTVAVDLSIWIVDSQCVKQMVGAVTRPHLRNLFFRTVAMLNADILPVFVIEGAAPKLKWQTMANRQAVRGGKSHGLKTKLSSRRANRSHFKAVVNECCEMLEYLGVPYVHSIGEAEATCATLNKAGLVDAVITEDGDAFLYGAETIYRSFTATKDPSVDVYKLSDIRSNIGLDRNHLVALGLLIGCDYCPKGVPGVGRTQAVKLCTNVPAQHILHRLLKWSSSGFYGDENDVEKAVAQRIRRMGESSFTMVIEEFLHASCKLPTQIGSWKKPLLSKAQAFNLSKLEWPLNYTLEKMIPLLTLWSMKAVSDGRVSMAQLTIQPSVVVKKRVRQGVECLEILWDISDPYDVDEDDEKVPKMTTVEPLQKVQRCFPSLIEPDSKCKPHTRQKPARARKKQPDNLDMLSDALVNIGTLGEVKDSCTRSPVAAKVNNVDLDSVSIHTDIKDMSVVTLDSTCSLLAELSELNGTNDVTSLSPRPVDSIIDEVKHESDKENDIACSQPVATMSCITPSLPKKNYRDKAKMVSRWDSLDCLLQDISIQLQSPVQCTQSPVIKSNTTGILESSSSLNSPTDRIISGYVTPAWMPSRYPSPSRQHSVDAGSIYRLSITDCDSPIPLFDITSHECVKSSELSLFDLSVHNLSTNRSICTKSTPLTRARDDSHGNFDLVPHLSEFSLDDFEPSALNKTSPFPV